MALKLSFKGDKKKTKKRTETVKKSLEDDLSNSNSEQKVFSINGEDMKIGDISLDKLTKGWTIMDCIDLQRATPSILDEEAGKLPIMITQTDNGKSVCLHKTKYMTPDNELKYKLSFTEDFELCDIGDQMFHTDVPLTADMTTNLIEPNGVHQVFILADISSIFKASNKFIEKESSNGKIYSIRTADREYLSFDPTTNDLTLTKTITKNGIFTLKFEDEQGLLRCRFIVGDEDECNTLIVTKSNDVKIIPDPDNVLGPMSKFCIKIRREDEHRTREIVKAKKESISSASGLSTSDGIDGKVKQTIVELSKAGFKITDKILKDMKRAQKEGHLNQWILDFKEKNVHDRRA